MKLRKAIALSLAIMILVAASVAGTIAWLQDSTQTVTNTFSTTGIDITLVESPIVMQDGKPVYEADGSLKYGTAAEGVTNAYPIIPKTTYTKDPVVSVSDNSVDCYLFVKFEENDSPKTFYTYESTLTTDNKWTPGDGTNIPANVWYRTVKTADAERSWHLLKGDTITVNESVKKTDMDAASKATLKWTAYAIQSANFADANAAWNQLKTEFPIG